MLNFFPTNFFPGSERAMEVRLDVGGRLVLDLRPFLLRHRGGMFIYLHTHIHTYTDTYMLTCLHSKILTCTYIHTDTLTECGAVIQVTQNTFEKMWQRPPSLGI